jgi:hypothetical protein
MAGSSQPIAWLVRPGIDPGPACVVEYSVNGGGTWTTIETLDGSAGQTAAPWTVPVATSAVLIRFRDPANAAYTDTVACTIAIGYALSLPARVYAGAPVTVSWTASLASGPIVDLHYSLDAGRTWTALDRLASTPGGTGTYTWRTPRTPCTDAQVRIRYPWQPTMADTATTLLAGLRLTAPTAGQAVTDGGTATVTWSSAGTGGAVRIQYATSDSLGAEPTTWTTLAGSAPDTGTYAWSIDAWPTARARIRVQSTSDIHIQDISPAFTVEVAP